VKSLKWYWTGLKPPYVPWSFGFTVEAKQKLQDHYGVQDLEGVLQNHLIKLGSDIGFFAHLGDDRVQDVFGVVWDRSLDKDIGIVEGCVLPEPTLQGYIFPDPLDPRFFNTIPDRLACILTATGFSRSVFRCTNEPGPCAAWKI
jgi:uroporphyrinogen decarboxylase